MTEFWANLHDFPMLYSERKAYAQMGAWRPMHRVLRELYRLTVRFRAARFLWRNYRKAWPDA